MTKLQIIVFDLDIEAEWKIWLTWLKRLKQKLKRNWRESQRTIGSWVWYCWIAMIDGKVGWNTDEYTTAFPAFWLAVFSIEWYKAIYPMASAIPPLINWDLDSG